MKKILCAMALIFPLILIGQNKAEELLNEVVQKTNAYQSMEVEFAYSLYNEEAGVHDSFEGWIILSGNKYRLNLGGQTVISDGENLYTYLKESNELMINILDTSSDDLTPQNILTSYNEDYKAKFTREKEENGEKVKLIELTPIEGKTYTKIYLDINETKKQIRKVEAYDKNGNVYTFDFKSIKPNVEISESTFEFNVDDFPGVYIEDLR